MLAINPQSKVERIGFVSPRLRLASPSGTLWFVASLGKSAESSLPIPSPTLFLLSSCCPPQCPRHSGGGLAISVSAGRVRVGPRHVGVQYIQTPFCPESLCIAWTSVGQDPGPGSEPRILRAVQSLYGQSDAWL